MVTSISFFIAGHQDDALLFRGEFLQTDVNTPGARVVHIVTTAGDNGWQPPWWQAREAGLVAAHNRAQAPDQYPTAVRKKFHRNVTVYDTPRWACYFLRLPDGNLRGQGFARTGYVSLVWLRNDKNRRMQAIDVTGNVPDSTYSWADVQGMLRAIVNHELAKLAQNPRPPQWFNMADNVASTNPGDHFDHYATTQAALLAGATAHHRVLWVSCATAGRPANLPAGLLAAKRTLFHAYADSVHAATGMGMDYFHDEWRQWGPKSYARVVRARAAS